MKYILLGILLLFSSFAYCQDNIYGTYESEDGLIMIKPVRDEGDFFLYYEKYTNDKGVQYKAKAVCKIEKAEEAEQLIKLNSIGARSSIYNGIEVTRESTPTHSFDTLYIFFDIPYNKTELYMDIYVDKVDIPSYEFIYSQESKCVKIPINPTNQKIAIHRLYPKSNYYSYQNKDNANSDNIKYVRLTLEFSLDGTFNNLTIKIPSLDNTYFDRYYIEGEYAKVFKNNIIWRDVTYQKRENQQESLLLYSYPYSLIF